MTRELVPSNDQIAEITPLQVLALDQFDFPIALPSFQLLLPRDRFFRPFEGLNMNQAINSVSFDKRRAFAVAMLLQPFQRELVTPIYSVP
jgi:hypothetical protein